MKTTYQKMLPVSLAVTAVGTAAVKTSADFEASMSKVAAIYGETGYALEELTKKAREMGSKTKFSVSEDADGMTYMTMAGWKTDENLNGSSPFADVLAVASFNAITNVSMIRFPGR